jgi:hypothetical protein
MPAPISSSVNMLFCFHCVCVRFAQLIWRIGAKPPTATFGNVTGCGRQMGSLAPSMFSSFVCRTRGKVCMYICHPLRLVMIDMCRCSVGVQ